MATFTPGHLGHSVIVGVDSDAYNNSKTSRTTSFYRYWRGLTHSQKRVAVFLSCSILGLFYILHHTKVPIDQLESDTTHRKHVLPLKNPLKDKEKRDNYIKSKYIKLNEKIKSLKRVPPGLRGIKQSMKPDISQPGNDFVSYKLINGVHENVLKEKENLNRFKNLPENQKNFAQFPDKINMTVKQMAVVEACKHAWAGYKRYAWGHDELRPLSQSYREWFQLGLTIIDSLDTLWLMNMKNEYEEARKWVAEELNFDKPSGVNLFETTIRVLGGLLSIHHLTSDKIYLEKATDLGDRLMGAFTSPSKIPYSDVNLLQRVGRPPSWGSDSSLSEVSTIQLEFNDLSHLTNNPKYRAAAYNVMLQIFSLKRVAGLCPIYVNPNTGEFRPGSHITLGARGDSYYEYLLKQWIQTGKKDEKMKNEYLTAMRGVEKLLVKKTPVDGLYYVGELLSGRNFSPKMDHLVCFLPGTLALGVYHGLPEEHMVLAKRLIETCYQMYARMATGLSPEIAHFKMRDSTAGEDIIVKPLDSHYLLRPETVESLHVMYQITKEQKYREYGWAILQAINKHTRVSAGYVSINDVTNAENPRQGGKNDKMESFFISETLKYLYLLFSDEDILPLDKYVFNTEAHPLPVIPTGFI